MFLLPVTEEMKCLAISERNEYSGTLWVIIANLKNLNIAKTKNKQKKPKENQEKNSYSQLLLQRLERGGGFMPLEFPGQLLA